MPIKKAVAEGHCYPIHFKRGYYDYDYDYYFGYDYDYDYDLHIIIPIMISNQVLVIVIVCQRVVQNSGESMYTIPVHNTTV